MTSGDGLSFLRRDIAGRLNSKLKNSLEVGIPPQRFGRPQTGASNAGLPSLDQNGWKNHSKLPFRWSVPAGEGCSVAQEIKREELRKVAGELTFQTRAEVAESADALDSKSSEAQTSCGFDPHLRHLAP